MPYGMCPELVVCVCIMHNANRDLDNFLHPFVMAYLSGLYVLGLSKCLW